MRILMSSVGTRGDVQPVLALALNLRNLGCDVRLCLPPNFVDQARELGFAAAAVGIEMRAPRAGASPAGPIPDLITDQFDVVGSAAEGCDLLLAGGTHQYAARSVAEARKIPCVVAVYAPVSLPSQALPPPGQAEFLLEPAANARMWIEYKRAWNTRSLDRVNANRARWKLGAIDDALGHILGENPWLAADPTLGPMPSTPKLEIIQTGAWMMEDDVPLPPSLEAFLDEGDPPIYCGFGSMPVPPGIGPVLVDAARALGRRIILCRGWSELPPVDQGQDCLVVDEANQQKLFTRVAAVIHHGGAGTTAAAARAGAPQLALPMFTDQFYWGQRLRNLGIGAAVPMAGLDASKLAEALDHVLEPRIAVRARSVAKDVVTNGAAAAARRLVELRR
jgi:vancomycin aglycone glucosyltransferase